MPPSGSPATNPPSRLQALGGVATQIGPKAGTRQVGTREDCMETALNYAAAHRSDPRLHVLGPSPGSSPQTVRGDGGVPPLAGGPESVIVDGRKRPSSAADRFCKCPSLGCTLCTWIRRTAC